MFVNSGVSLDLGRKVQAEPLIDCYAFRIPAALARASLSLTLSTSVSNPTGLSFTGHQVRSLRRFEGGGEGGVWHSFMIFHLLALLENFLIVICPFRPSFQPSH
jgi:hypothetical protein